MKANSYFYAWTSYQQRYLIYPLNSYMILNILGREYIFVTSFNPCNLVPFRLQVVHDGVESFGDFLSVPIQRLPLWHQEIPAFKARTVALIGRYEFLAYMLALFMSPNSFYYNPDYSHRSGYETGPDLTHRCDPASLKSRYSEVNLRAKK